MQASLGVNAGRVELEAFDTPRYERVVGTAMMGAMPSASAPIVAAAAVLTRSRRGHPVVEHFRPMFIVGPPRTGSTLLCHVR